MFNNNVIPREKGLDQTLSLMREGYMYISNRCHSFQSDIFETRLFGKKAICMRGKKAAELFYDNEKFKRQGAAPKRIVKSFFGKNSVQTLDGYAHQNRKNMLMSVMTTDRIQQLVNITRQQWENSITYWEQKDQIIFYEEVQKLLCKAACEWVGVPLEKIEIDKRTKDLASLFESTVAFGPVYWSGRNSRKSLDKWIGEIIDGIRNGNSNVDDNTILYQFALYRDLEANLLKKETVTVEIINLLRPIVAISIFLNFLFLAIYHHPEETKKVKSGDEQYSEMFVQEIRRFFPFFPFIAALVRKDFNWGDYQFKKGVLTILDIYGTNHDPKRWENPKLFNPNRFADWKGSPFGFIPQGGGDYWMGHRCAGEWVTIEVMKVSLSYLTERLDYEVPNQDLSYSMVSIPSIPKSKIIIKNIRKRS